MADYLATARTNSFRIKSLDAFKKDLDRHGIQHGSWTDRAMGLIIDDGPDNQPEGSIELFSSDDHGTWPAFGCEIADIYDRISGTGATCVRFTAPEDSTDALPEEKLCLNCDAAESEHDVDLDPEDYYVFDLPALVSRHLVDGDVAVFLEVGAAKMCYLGGIAYAINSKGESEMVDLDDIYAKAAHLGTTVTRAHS